MHERKAAMAAASDAFIALPGGFGTLEELMEVITWQQLGFHAKPVALLNVQGFFDPLLAFFSHGVQQGFVDVRTHQRLIVHDDPDVLMDSILAWTPPESNVIADAMARAAAIGRDIAG
jgi:uncharacterized protein (TIGR00730 family)